MKHFLDGPRTPVVVDRRFDIFFIALWTNYALWAMAACVEAIPSISNVASVWYQFVWAGAVGTFSLLAAIFTFLGFLPTRASRVQKERAELIATIFLAGTIAVYPSVLLYNLTILGNASVFAGFVVSLSYLLAPIYRCLHLFGRIKQNV